MSLRKHRRPPRRVAAAKRTVFTLEELFHKQKGRCAYCKQPMFLGSIGIKAATVDHVIPKSRGGKDSGNRVAACKYCNNEKADMTAEEYAFFKAEQLEKWRKQEKPENA